MDTHCARLVADLFLFCYERYFMMSLTYDTQAIIEDFNSISRYLDGLLNIGNKRQKHCLWKHRTSYELENGSLGFIETLISSNGVYNTAYAL